MTFVVSKVLEFRPSKNENELHTLTITSLPISFHEPDDFPLTGSSLDARIVEHILHHIADVSACR